MPTLFLFSLGPNGIRLALKQSENCLHNLVPSHLKRNANRVLWVHAEKSIFYSCSINQNQSVFTVSRLISNQKEFRLIQIQLENGKYTLIPVSWTRIVCRFVVVREWPTNHSPRNGRAMTNAPRFPPRVAAFLHKNLFQIALNPAA